MPARNPSTYVISLTCFDEDDRFDAEAQRGHFRRLAEAGIGVFVGGGGSGEGYTQSRDEYRQLMQVAKEELKGKVPCRFMGIEPRSAREMVEMYDFIKPYEFDAMQIYSLDQGHGGAPMGPELEAYFRDCLDGIPMPCVISTHQSVGYYIPVPMMKKLVASYPQVIGLNLTSPDLKYVTEMVDEVGDKIEIHTGGPNLGLTILSLGGQGFLSSEANLAPRLAVSVIDHYKAGDMESCFSAFGTLMRVSRWNRYGSIRGIKAALSVLGLPGGHPRRPRLPVSEEQEAEIAGWLDDLEVSRIEGLA